MALDKKQTRQVYSLSLAFRHGSTEHVLVTSQANRKQRTINFQPINTCRVKASEPLQVFLGSELILNAWFVANKQGPGSQVPIKWDTLRMIIC